MAEKRAKKPMSEEQLERLAEARKKANEMRKVNQAKRLQTKMDNLKYNGDGTPKEQLESKEVKENVEENIEEKEQVKEEVKEEVEEETPPEEEVIIKKKPQKKKKQTIIVEQSEDDSDEFESSQNVLFVKRISKKKEVKLPEPPPQQEYIPPPVKREHPAIPRKTKNELIYDNMFSGNFLNQMNRRF